MNQDEHIQRLMDLGLSLLQAKVYLNLVKLEKADVKTIAKASNVARQDIYQIMPNLERLGLTEKILAKTTFYKATPIKEGLSILLQNKKEEYVEIEKKTSSVLKNLHAYDSKDFQDDDSKFIITSERKLFHKRMEKAFLQIQTCDMLLPAEGLKIMLFKLFQSLKMAEKKGAKIRIVTEKIECASIERKLQTLKKNPLFEIKFVSLPLREGVMIFNNTEVNLCISSNSEVPSLWTNNPQVVKVVKRSFEATRNTAEIN
jgi:sugar-specific transcriptional regulator TrmB